MRVDVNVVKDIAFNVLVPIVCAFIGGVIGYMLQAKRETTKAMPRLQVIVLNSVQALKTNENMIRGYNNFIYIKNERHPRIDENIQKEKELKFYKKTYKQIMEEVKKHPIIFMGFLNDGKETIMLKKVFYDTDYEIDGQVVPATNNKQNNYCFFCSVADAPSALQGKTNGKYVKYDVKKMNDIIDPRAL